MNDHYHIFNGWIVNEQEMFKGGLMIRNGRIDRIYRGKPSEEVPGAIPVDAGNQWILPGIIDDHVHFREPGLTHKGDLLTESSAAVAGGITSFMDMPNTIPPVLSQAQLEEKYQLASEKSLANYSFYMGASNTNLAEVLKTDPATVCGVKVFMGSSTGNMLLDDRRVLRSLFAQSPVILAAHCEDESTVRNNTMEFRQRYGDDPPVTVHPRIRSEEACYRSAFLAVQLAKEFNTKLHLLHLSTAREVDLLDGSLPLEKKRITGEVCLHHLWFTEQDYSRCGMKIKWNPAIKTENDRNTLFEALLHDKIDVVATDHAPHTLEEKNKGYYHAPSGAPLVQHSLVAMLEFYHQGKISLEMIVRKMCHNPAILFQIKDRGFLREGYWADVVLVSPDDPWTVTGSSGLLYKCGWSPFEGQTFRSRVTHTFVNGHLVYNSGKIDGSHIGKRLVFNR
ncbi:MAG: dihydroorotase [Bacteroidales bacterium]|nr:dihydroorotase [Lentimicrobiaceae bacterium]MDD5693717.1 dihydroorotase [Bacteroidales bacterium]